MTESHLQHIFHKEGVESEQLRKIIAEHAYFKAEKRGFAPGHEMDDWLEAEQEVHKLCFYWTQEEWQPDCQFSIKKIQWPFKFSGTRFIN